MLTLLFITILNLVTSDTVYGIKDIHIYNQVGNIRVVHSSVPYIKITEYNPDTTRHVFEVHKKLSKHRLRLEIKPKESCSQCGAEVLLGMDSLSKLDIEVASGKVSIRGKIDRLTVSLMSGNADIKGKFQKLRVEILSGNLKLDNVRVDSLDASISSGDVRAEFENVLSDGKINVLSGNVYVSSVTGQKIFAVLSSKLDTVEKEGNGYLHIKVTSGTLKLKENQ